MSTIVTQLDVIKYYDQCEVDYKLLWHLNNIGAMHYGMWLEDTNTLRKALNNLNAFILSKLDINLGDQILDAGCGIGGTSRYIAKRHDVSVHGITLSGKQVDTANELKKNSSIIGKMDFSVQDYCNTRFEDESFNSIYAIESVCHAQDKSEFLKECYRQLKPGGTLVIAGFFASDKPMSQKQSDLMVKWANSWAVPAFEKNSTFSRFIKEEGLELIEVNDITTQIMKSSRRLYNYFIPGLIFHHILKSLSLRNKIQGKNVWSTYYQYKCLKEGLWNYKVFKLRK